MNDNYHDEEDFINEELPNEELFHAHVVKDDFDLIAIDSLLRTSYLED